MNKFLRKKYESFNDAQQDSMPDARLKQELLQFKSQLPLEQEFAQESISVPTIRKVPEYNLKFGEWAIQQTNHIQHIADKSSSMKTNRMTQEGPQLLNEQKCQRILNLNKQSRQKSRFDFDLLQIIEPSSSKLITWNAFIFILIIGQYYLISLHAFFTQSNEDLKWFWDQWFEGHGLWLNWLFLLILTFDIFVELHVAHFDKGSYVTDKFKVYHQYLRTEFIFDFIPLLSLYIIQLSTWAQYSVFMRLLFLLKIYKLIIYDQRLQDILQLHRKSKAAYLIIKLLLEMFMLMQTFAAIFYRVGITQQNRRLEDEVYAEQWESWLDSSNLFGPIYLKPIVIQYYMALYWSIGTLSMVSYGDVTPANPPEILVSCLAMFGAIFFFAFNVQTIWEVYNSYMETKRKFQKQLIVVNRFMRDKKISVGLQNKIRKYLDHMWEKQRARDDQMEKQILDSLAPQLKSELLFESYGRDLLQIPWFQNNFSVEFIKSLSQDLQEVYYTQGEVIFTDRKQNYDDDSMYIIKEGAVLLYINSTKTQLSRLGEDQVFGQYSFLTGDLRQSSAKSLSYTTLYRINRSQFLNRLAKFPDDYERYCALRDKVSLDRQLDLINLQCYTCNMPDHMSVHCPLSHPVTQLQRNSKIIEQNQAIQNRRKSHRRKNKKTKKTTVGVEEYENEDNPFADFEQYYQDKQYESCVIDKVQSFAHYYPKNNIDNLSHRRFITELLNPRYTPLLRHQVEPV